MVALGYLTTSVKVNSSTYSVNSSGLVDIGSVVTAVKIAGTLTPYSPTAGVVEIPAYPTIPTNVSAFTNDAGYVSTSVSLSDPHLVLASPSGSGGPASFRALVASDIPDLSSIYATSDTWRTVQCNGVSIGNNALNLVAGTNVAISASNGTLTFSSTDTINTAGAIQLGSTKLYLVGAASQTDGVQTYSNVNCYIGTDGCLYSNGSKVQTTATGYLPLTGGTLTGGLCIYYTQLPFYIDKVSYTWAGNTNAFPLLHCLEVERWDAYTMIATPHVPFLKNNNRGYAGSTFGAIIRFEGKIQSYTANPQNYWDCGVPTEDNFQIKRHDTGEYVMLDIANTGKVRAAQFATWNGTSSQFMKADGSLDSTSYATQDTWRTVQCNGVSIGNNALNLVAGTNVTISASNGTLIFSSAVSGYLPTSGGTITGSLSIGNSKSPNAAAWGNCLVVGADGHDKVIMGYLASGTNEAVVGGHSTGLDAWEPINICGSTVKIRSSETLIMTFSLTNGYTNMVSNNYNLYVQTGSGSPYVAKQWSVTSDIRKKDIVNYIDLNLGMIAQAPIFNFTWKDYPNTRPSVGTSAQYWEKVLPYSVSEGPDGYLSFDYGATALAAAVLTARKVSEHERRIADLERENKVLWNMIATLKAS